MILESNSQSCLLRILYGQVTDSKFVQVSGDSATVCQAVRPSGFHQNDEASDFSTSDAANVPIGST